jgi:hypothetical protein
LKLLVLDHKRWKKVRFGEVVRKLQGQTDPVVAEGAAWL